MLLKHEMEKPIVSQHQAGAFAVLTHRVYKVISRSIDSCVFTDMQKKYVPARPLGLALKYFKDLEMHPTFTKPRSIDLLKEEEKVL